MELLEQVSEKLGTHHYGSERSEAELEQRRKADAEKINITRRLRAETSMTWSRIAERLAMGTSDYTADCLRTT